MVLGIVLAAVSMLVIPIVGSYMKVLAVELRSQPLKAAAIFTFGNSYLSMVLLVALADKCGHGIPLGRCRRRTGDVSVSRAKRSADPDRRRETGVCRGVVRRIGILRSDWFNPCLACQRLCAATAPEELLVIDHVTIFDGNGGPVLKNGVNRHQRMIASATSVAGETSKAGPASRFSMPVGSLPFPVSSMRMSISISRATSMRDLML